MGRHKIVRDYVFDNSSMICAGEVKLVHSCLVKNFGFDKAIKKNVINSLLYHNYKMCAERANEIINLLLGKEWMNVEKVDQSRMRNKHVVYYSVKPIKFSKIITNEQLDEMHLEYGEYKVVDENIIIKDEEELKRWNDVRYKKTKELC